MIIHYHSCLGSVDCARSELFRQSALAPFGKEPLPRSVFTAQLVSSGTVSLVFWRIISIGGFSVDCARSEKFFSQSALAPFGRSFRLDRYLPPTNWSVRVLCL